MLEQELDREAVVSTLNQIPGREPADVCRSQPQCYPERPADVDGREVNCRSEQASEVAASMEGDRGSEGLC